MAMKDKRAGRTPKPKTTDDPGTDLDVRTQTGILASEASVIKALGIPIGFRDVAEPGDVMAGILAEIEASGSVEKALALGVTEGLQDHVGRVLTFLDYKYQPSEFDPEGWPFVVIRVVDEDGHPTIATTGAKQVVALLALARRNGDLPFKARVDVTEFDTPDGERRRAVKLIAPE